VAQDLGVVRVEASSRRAAAEQLSPGVQLLMNFEATQEAESVIVVGGQLPQVAVREIENRLASGIEIAGRTGAGGRRLDFLVGLHMLFRTSWRSRNASVCGPGSHVDPGIEVSSIDEGTMDDKDTRVHTVEGEFEAQQVKAFLEAHGIPCTFKGESLRKTHGLTLDGLGYVEIHVPLELVSQARELIAEVEAGRMTIGPDDLPQDD
jgi:hypothetical protein